jgi:hypothetical protein
MPKKIKVCKSVPLSSNTAKKYIKKLHGLQHKRGHVKLPGIRKRHIVNHALRKEAKLSSKHRSNVLRRLRRKSKKKYPHLQFSTHYGRLNNPIQQSGAISSKAGKHKKRRIG